MNRSPGLVKVLERRVRAHLQRLRISAIAAAQRQDLRTRAVRAAKTGLRHVLENPPPLKVDLDPTMPFAHDAVLSREGKGVVVSLSAHNPALTAIYGPPRLAAYLYWLLHCDEEVRRISVTLSDGDRASGAIFSPSTFLPDVVAVPDPIFFNTRGYRRERTMGIYSGIPWDERSNDLVWRGGMNSPNSFDPEMAGARPHYAAQRLLACLALRDVPGTDVKFVRPNQPETAAAAYRTLAIEGEWLAPHTWLGRKFALDIDGHSNAWANFFTRLLFGCCVLKVASRYGYRQWYYDRLQPWKHFVPLAADLSDLAEKLDWVKRNDAACRDIAQHGRAVAMALTLDVARDEAAALIGANWQRRRG